MNEHIKYLEKESLIEQLTKQNKQLQDRIKFLEQKNLELLDHIATGIALPAEPKKITW